MQSPKQIFKLRPVVQITLIIGITLILVLVATMPSAGPNLINFLGELVSLISKLQK